MTIEDRLPAQIPDYKDRRTKRRFAIEQALRYRTLTGKQISGAGVGRTINISSSGVCFASDKRLATGISVELSINWPVLLLDSCPMKLMIHGCIIRSSNDEAVLVIERYEFHTRGSRAPSVSLSDAESWESV